MTTTPENDNPENAPNHEIKFTQTERELLMRGGAATYFANLLANLPDIPQDIKQDAQYFLWFGRCPVNVDIKGVVS